MGEDNFPPILRQSLQSSFGLVGTDEERKTQMTFDPSKPVQTRYGRKARIAFDDFAGPKPIIAAIDYGDHEVLDEYYSNGLFHPNEIQSDTDLVNVPEKHVRWMNLYHNDQSAVLHPTKEEAMAVAGPNCIARKRIEFTEGEFDD